MGKFMNGLYFSPKDGGSGGNGDDPKPDGKEETQPKEDLADDVLKWDAFHASLPDDAKALIEEHESGLRTALNTERDSRKTAEGDLRKVAKKLKDGSEAQTEVLRLADEVAASTKKADFYEDAHGAEVTNLKYAYIIAEAEDLFDKKGNVDFVAMKKDYPELFTKKKAPPGGAGEGTGGGLPGKKKDMNTILREAAGKTR